MGKDIFFRKYPIKSMALTVCICSANLLLFWGFRHYQCSQTETKTSHSILLAKPKVILWWTPFFHTYSLFDQLLERSGPLSLSSNCAYNCHFTLDRQLLNQSDAVLFHGRGWIGEPDPGFVYQLLSDIPTTRLASQFWIFYLWENPLYTFFPADSFPDFFNVTMTYRRDSDIFAPVGRLIDYSDNEIAMETTGFASKPKLIAWIVSDCTSTNKRENVVADLKKYIPVDVYGKCGNFTCSADSGMGEALGYRKRYDNPCFSEIGGTYKFYLSFENSYCKDYVTEKFFHALAAGMVPIVNGAADYELYAPKGSFINIKDFESMKQLADYLQFLDANPEEYLKYFEWQKQLKVDPVSFHVRAFCNLCEKLTTGNLEPKPANQDFRNWWWGDNDSVCKQE